MTQKITSNERKVLRAVLTNYFTSLNGGLPTEYEVESVWANCINDSNEPSGVEGKRLSGVISSLNSKGLVRSSGKGEDACVALTEDGYNAAL